jgi:very-short-patch-repair endonuclease
MQKNKTENFVNKACLVHGDVYDYSLVHYKGNKQKVIIRCPKGHLFEKAPSHHLNGQGCSKCGKLAVDTDDFINKAVAVHGNAYSYGDVVYKPTLKLPIFCNSHKITFHQTANHHLNGQGCPKCRYDKSADSQRKSKEQFVAEANAVHGGKFDYSDFIYVTTNIKSVIKCPQHGAFMQQPSIHLNGSGCADCSGVAKKTTDSFIKQARVLHGDRYDYGQVIYKGIFSKVFITCRTHGDFEQIAKDHLEGCGCPRCSELSTRISVSKPERELISFIKTLGVEVVPNKRLGDSNNFKFDCLIPSHKIAIEFNGMYWHSVANKERNYHLNKRRFAEQNGYRLISVWEDEWFLNTNKIKALLTRTFSKPERVGGRETIVVSIDRPMAVEFHKTYHIQNDAKSLATLHYGVLRAGELIAVASFSKDGTLHRYTIAEGLSIVGGLQKILKKVIADTGMTKLTTYCDRDLFEGKLYVECGFIKTKTTPQLTYKEGNKRVRRERYMKHKLSSLLPKVDMSKTEVDICKENGIFACYNSGVDTYVLIT